MKVEIILRMQTYSGFCLTQQPDQYMLLGDLEINEIDKLNELKEFIQAGIRAYEDEHPRI